jgi:hypothetical protein
MGQGNFATAIHFISSRVRTVNKIVRLLPDLDDGDQWLEAVAKHDHFLPLHAQDAFDGLFHQGPQVRSFVDFFSIFRICICTEYFLPRHSERVGSRRS